jgi:L-rhamnose mutarotase
MHEPGSVWPGVIDHIRANGVENMEIWHHGDRLFMIMDATDEYPRRDASHVGQQESDRWEGCMAQFQRALPGTAPGEKWLALRRIFLLAEHKGLYKP